MFGLAAGWAGWTVHWIVTSPRVVDPRLGRFEENRREVLRQKSWVYQWFEPWIDQMVARMGDQNLVMRDRVRRQLVTAAQPLPWLPEERIAVWRVEALIAALIGAALGWFFGGAGMAIVAALLTFMFYYRSKASGLSKRADERRKQIRRALAGAIDLLTLMIEVGGNFHESLVMVAERLQMTPLGDELNKVLSDIAAGTPRRDALRNFADRVDDDDARELVFAIVQGEELGTPLSAILRRQANQIRQKRSQWAEKAAEEAEVNIVFPAMVIMVACLIIVAAPFIINALAP